MGEQIAATHKSGKTEVYQRQAGFIATPGKVLVFTLTSPRPLMIKQTYSGTPGWQAFSRIKTNNHTEV